MHHRRCSYENFAPFSRPPIILGLLGANRLAELDLSKAQKSQIVKVAQTDAKEFYQGHKANPEELSDALEYASGRAIKHGLLEGMPKIYCTNAFMDVLKQLEIDKE